MPSAFRLKGSRDQGSQGLGGSGAHGFKGSMTQGLKGSGAHGFKGSMTQGLKGSWVQGPFDQLLCCYMLRHRLSCTSASSARCRLEGAM